MRYVEARFEEKYRDEAYRIYVTRSLQLAPQGKYIQINYGDLLKPQKIDNRSGDEIAMSVIEKAGLSFGG